MSSDFDQLFNRPGGSWAQRMGESRPAPSPAATPTEAPDGSYKPWGFTPSDDQDGCDVRWWLTADIPQGLEFDYRFLQRVGWIGDDQLHICLSDCLIAIEGSGLLELRKKLMRRRVTFIQVFHPMIWPTPQPGQPLVTKVDVLSPGEKLG